MDTLKKTLAPVFKLLICGLFSFLLGGCQLGYLAKSAYNQLNLLNQRIPIDEALKDPDISPADKLKLTLSQEVRKYSETTLKLNVKKNYSTYVKLNRPYVSYVVSASPKWSLETHHWNFPFVGKLPYKGYFSEAEANEEAELLMAQNYDVYVRGVSAYSTLGWFKDPLLSSMLRYKDHDLVNTIIHESVHATLFIKNEAEFNERLATFLGNKGMEMFYLQKESENSETLKLARRENADEKRFSVFISEEIKALELWYQNQKEKTESFRVARLNEIKINFTKKLKPFLTTESYSKFTTLDLNNARLIVYKTYLQDMNDLEQLYQLNNNDFVKFFKSVKRLEAHDKPSEGIKEIIAELADARSSKGSL